jgi:hypothetical protein
MAPARGNRADRRGSVIERVGGAEIHTAHILHDWRDRERSERYLPLVRRIRGHDTLEQIFGVGPY